MVLEVQKLHVQTFEDFSFLKFPPLPSELFLLFMKEIITKEGSYRFLSRHTISQQSSLHKAVNATLSNTTRSQSDQFSLYVKKLR